MKKFNVLWPYRNMKIGREANVIKNLLTRLEEFPVLIHAKELEVLNFKRAVEEADEDVRNRYNILFATQYNEVLGPNKETRTAAFELLLEGDKVYKDLLRGKRDIEWATREQELEVKRLEKEYHVLTLRIRSSIVSAEIFGGVPIFDATRH